MEDRVMPQYKKRIAAGEVINNPCYYSKDTIAEGTDGYMFQQNTTGYWYALDGPLTSEYSSYFSYEDLWGDYIFPVKTFRDGIRRARLEALSRMDLGPYAFGEDIGEARQTLRFLKNPVNSILGLGRTMRAHARKAAAKKEAQRRARRQKSGGSRKTIAAESLKILREGSFSAHAYSTAFADIYLQYRFALGPLLRSADDAIQAFIGSPKTKPPRLTARGHEYDSGDNEDPITLGTAPGYTYTFSRNATQMYIYHAAILYEVTNPIYGNAWRLGLRTRDLPYVMWQLLPYSFVLDRMVDVSSFIRAILNLQNPQLNILAGSVTTRREDITELSCTGRTAPNWTFSLTPTVRTKRKFQYDRRPWTPSVKDAIPEVTPRGLVDDSIKMLDNIALFLQLTRH